MENWKASAAATMVGSMPHTDREGVIDLVFREFPQVPVWPQLAAFPPEQMMNQYLEGLPGIRTEEGRVFLDTAGSDFDRELVSFYEEYLELESQSGDILESRFKMGAATGRTFASFLEKIPQAQGPILALKGQVTGPFTLLSGLKDQNGRALLYDDRFQDVIPKHLALKARWQIRQLKEFGHPVIMFLDEPALAGLGSSAFISVSEELVQQLLKEVADAVHQDGALAGVHICANTDWRLVFHSPVDIINFDSYNFFEKFALYRDDFLRFIKEGRTVAWGVVPTSDPALIELETPETLADRWLQHIQSLVDSETTVDRILSQSLFTPSCGCGSLTEALAERVLYLTRETARILAGS